MKWIEDDWYPSLKFPEGIPIPVELVGKINNPWKEGEVIYVAKTKTGKTYRLPTSTVLMRKLKKAEDVGAKYVVIKYTGKKRTKSGYNVKNYDLAVLDEEEYKNFEFNETPVVQTTQTDAEERIQKAKDIISVLKATGADENYMRNVLKSQGFTDDEIDKAIAGN